MSSKYWTDHNPWEMVVGMYTGNPDVPDDDFTDVLKQIKDFVRTRVVPREQRGAA